MNLVQQRENECSLSEGEYRNRTGVHGFAIRPESQEDQCAIVSNRGQTNPEQNAKVSNANSGPPKENAGAAATASGDSNYHKSLRNTQDSTLKRPYNAMSLHAKDAHKRAARMFGYSLTLGTSDAWLGASAVWAARLSVPERVSLAYAALTALDREDALATAEAVLCGAGMPLAPLFDFMDEAAFWADLAEPDEIEAYCLATFNRMPKARQAAFLDHVQGKVAA